MVTDRTYPLVRRVLLSLEDVGPRVSPVEDGGRFEGFSHVDDWVPQRLVTATGANPLPR